MFVISRNDMGDLTSRRARSTGGHPAVIHHQHRLHPCTTCSELTPKPIRLTGERQCGRGVVCPPRSAISGCSGVVWLPNPFNGHPPWQLAILSCITRCTPTTSLRGITWSIYLPGIISGNHTWIHFGVLVSCISTLVIPAFCDQSD